jgi:hypothetical protein
MINFTRAFDSAWERMTIILFRPFDLGKWFLIGLSAFLAGLMGGGNGANFRYNQNFNTNWNQSQGQSPNFQVELQHLHARIMNFFSAFQLGVIILIIMAIVAIVLVLSLVFLWLGARGQFLLLDNIVRNRASISIPWVNYARPANSLFLFYLVVMFISLVIFVPILIIGVVMAIPLFRQDRWPVGGEIAGFVALGLTYLALALVLNVVLFLFREFGVPLMFRNGLMAFPAFKETVAVVARNPGNVSLFILLRIALAVAVWVISVVACCFCCIGIIPYIGTVAILPALIYVRCFTLDCLAQFGPQYDVWTVDVAPPPVSTTASPFSPRPPLG